MTQFFKMTIRPYTQLEVFSLGLRSMKMHSQHFPWPAQLPDLNIIEPLLPVLEQILYSINSQESKRRSA
jgi:hypothetical protein